MQQKKIGRYEIQELLGTGGMGSVHRAFDPVRHGDVALKVINLDALRRTSHEKRNETLKRFRHEVRVIAQLQHVAIVPLFDSGDDNGTPYMVMPLMKGGSLEGRLLDKHDNPQPLPLAEIERILAWIAPALDKMHAQNIVHRDLKPANILFDGDDHAYIADFGIAKLTEGSITFNTGTIGTPAYMSPEQAEDQKKVDPRSDVYSLGAMLYKMLTGERPYHRAHPAILPYYHINEPPPRLDELRSDLHPSWQTIIDKAMAKKPEERYQTASKLSAAVTQLLRDEAQEEARERKTREEAARQAELARLRREAEAAREEALREKQQREAALRQAEAARQQAWRDKKRYEVAREQTLREKKEREAALRQAKTARQQALHEKQQREAKIAHQQVLRDKKQREATLRQTTPTIPILSPINPLDPLRLLWWTLITPQQLKDYQEQHGKATVIQTSKWLVSTLIWWPLLFLTLALGLETLPHDSDTFLATIYLLMSGGLSILWLLTGLFGEINYNNKLEIVTGVAAGIVRVSVIVVVVVSVAVDLFVNFIAMFLVFIAIFISILTSFLFSTKAMERTVFEIVSQNIESGRQSWLTRCAFAALVAAHAFLLWFCFFGGWRAFA